MREYGKLRSKFWTDDDLQSLSDQCRLLAAYLITGPHTTMLGCYWLPIGYIATDLGWERDKITSTLDALAASGFLTYERGWVLLRTFLKHNPLENPNQRTAAIKLAREIPLDNAVWPALLRAAETLDEELRHGLETVSKGFRKGWETVPEPLPKGSPRPAQPFRNQKQKQKQEQKQEQEQEQTQEQEQEQEAVDAALETAQPAATAADPPTDPVLDVEPQGGPVVVIRLPLNDGTEYGVTEDQVDEWVKLYPAIDVEQCLRSMRGWCLSHARERKTRRGILTFITGWLNSDQNDGRHKRRDSSMRAEPPPRLDYRSAEQTADWAR